MKFMHHVCMSVYAIYHPNQMALTNFQNPCCGLKLWVYARAGILKLHNAAMPEREKPLKQLKFVGVRIGSLMARGRGLRKDHF